MTTASDVERPCATPSGKHCKSCTDRDGSCCLCERLPQKKAGKTWWDFARDPDAAEGEVRAVAKRLRCLFSKVTHGPWRSRVTDLDHVQVVAGTDPPDAGVAECGLNLGGEGDWPAVANAALIAESRNELAALLDAAEEAAWLRHEVRVMRAQVAVALESQDLGHRSRVSAPHRRRAADLPQPHCEDFGTLSMAVSDCIKEIKTMCANLSDRTLDDMIKPYIAAWSEPPTALQVLKVLDLCIYGGLCSSFEIKLFTMLLDEACEREKTTRGDLEARAEWRHGLE